MTVAVFAGELPSTLFIQRLVDGLAKSGTRVLLMGKIKGELNTNSPTIRIIGTRRGVFHLFLFLKYFTFLQFQKPVQKKKLDVLLQEKGLYSWKKRAFYYPVLYYQPDVFHLQWAKSVADWIWVEDFGIRMVLSLRGTHINSSPIQSPTLAQVYREVFPKVSRFHAVSDAIALQAQKYSASIDRIDTVYSGLPLEELPYKQKQSQSKTLRIISVGRNHWMKGYLHALDAVAKLRNYGTAFQYTLIGIYPDEELLFQYHELGLGQHVQFLPKCSFNQVKDMIQSSDVLLLPSIEEGIANVVLESMALGTLVITSDCGGMTEVVSNHINGIVVPILDSDAIANALRYVNNLSIEEYQSYTLAARMKIERDLNELHMINGMQSIYKKVLDI
jgi:glycosyltransferase involved in cell wall biosynthesis